MRPTMLLLAAAAAFALTTSQAQAWSGYGGAYRPGGYYGYGGYSALGFGAAAAQTKAKYSRYNFNTHPRSYYNEPYYCPAPSYYRSPPRGFYGHQYEYYGRGYGQWFGY